MKNMSVIFLSLFALTFGLCGNAMAEPWLTEKTIKNTTESVITCMNGSKSECFSSATKAALYFVIPAAEAIAVGIASTLGATASTGTPISALSGAAALSATKAIVGEAVISATGGILAGVAAPSVIGGAVIVGGGAAVAGAIWWYLK